MGYKWFIRRPHAVDRLRERAGIPDAVDDTSVEKMLREELARAERDEERTFLRGCEDGQLAIRVEWPEYGAAYAIAKPASGGKDYDFIVPTVITVEMYQSSSRDGRLGTIGELPTKKRPLPKIKPQLLVLWQVDGREMSGTYCADDVPDQVRKLLDQGVRLDAIKVYREVPFSVDVALGSLAA